MTPSPTTTIICWIYFYSFYRKYKHISVYTQTKYILNIAIIFLHGQNITITIHMFKLLSHSHILYSHHIVQHTSYRVQQFNLIILNGLKWIIYEILNIRSYPLQFWNLIWNYSTFQVVWKKSKLLDFKIKNLQHF